MSFPEEAAAIVIKFGLENQRVRARMISIYQHVNVNGKWGLRTGIVLSCSPSGSLVRDSAYAYHSPLRTGAVKT